MSILSPLITVMLSAVTNASRTLARDFGEVFYLQSSPEERVNSFAMAAYKRSASEMKSYIRDYNRNYNFVLYNELQKSSPGSEHWWLSYPIYPLSDFSNALHDFSVCLVLMYGKLPIAAVIHFPVLCETFFVEKGHGAYMEDMEQRIVKLRVSSKQSLSECILVSNQLDINKITGSVLKVRVSESYMVAAAYTAAGRYDLFTGIGLNEIERLIVKLIISEASGSFAVYNENMIVGGNRLVAEVCPT